MFGRSAVGARALCRPVSQYDAISRRRKGDVQLADGALEVFGELDVVADELADLCSESVDGHG